MKYVIDEDVCSKHHLSISEVLTVLLYKECDNFSDLVSKMLDEEVLTIKDGIIKPSKHYDNEVQSILLTSDKTVPERDRCELLAIRLRALFPKGIKTGNATWRGNLREITLRLQKFFKLYGNKWSDDDIITATEKYIQHFNGDYTYMRILKYFIMKSEVKIDEEGNGHIEDISELANWLENEMENIDDNWLNEIK